MNILFLTEISTFPVKGGEKLRSYGLIKMLSDLGHHVTAIINKSSEIKQLDNVEFYEFDFRKYAKKIKIGKQFWNDMQIFFQNDDLIQLIESVLAKRDYQIAFVDYAFLGQYISFFKKKNLKVIYGTHNAEAHLIVQRPSINWNGFINNKLSFIMQTIHERTYFKQSDALFVVSENDNRFYQKFISKEKIHTIPNMLDERDYVPYDGPKENYIIMSGNFFAFQNMVGVEWFVKNVWNKDLWGKTKLILAGIYSSEVFSQLKEKYSFENIEALGIVDDMKVLIKRAKASVVPLLDGGGTRLKCLEAMALKTQVISTSKGAEGIEHSGAIIIADNPVVFRQKILDVLNDKANFTEEAHNIFMQEYSFAANEMKIKKIIENFS